jgi:hypothetical protein
LPLLWPLLSTLPLQFLPHNLASLPTTRQRIVLLLRQIPGLPAIILNLTRTGLDRFVDVRGPGPLAAGPELGLGRMVREIAGD